MIPLMVGLVSSLLFLGLSMLVYGIGAPVENPWVALVFFALIGSGLLVYLTSRPMPDWLCRLRARMRLARGIGGEPLPCGR